MMKIVERRDKRLKREVLRPLMKKITSRKRMELVVNPKLRKRRRS